MNTSTTSVSMMTGAAFCRCRHPAKITFGNRSLVCISVTSLPRFIEKTDWLEQAEGKGAQIWRKAPIQSDQSSGEPGKSSVWAFAAPTQSDWPEKSPANQLRDHCRIQPRCIIFHSQGMSIAVKAEAPNAINVAGTGQCEDLRLGRRRSVAKENLHRGHRGMIPRGRAPCWLRSSVTEFEVSVPLLVDPSIVNSQESGR